MEVRYQYSKNEEWCISKIDLFKDTEAMEVMVVGMVVMDTGAIIITITTDNFKEAKECLAHLNLIKIHSYFKLPIYIEIKNLCSF